jgi:predicted membrane protein
MAFDPASNPSSSPLPPPEPGAPWDRGRYFRHHHHHHRGHGIISGLVVIAWGGLLLMRELGVLDPSLRVIDFWPLLLVGFGLSLAVRRRGLGGVLVGLTVLLLGAGMLAEKLGYVVGGVAHLWPLVIVAAGLAIIWAGMTRRRTPRLVNERVSADELQRSVTMGALALAVDSQQFKGGALSATMGEVRVDLRRAAMSAEEATLELSLVMGGIELYVPTNWQVVSDVSPFMGAVEDKTEPRPDAAGIQRRLVLRGKITMGAVTITN